MTTLAESIGETSTDKFELAGRTFTSRLIVGTGKYRSFEEMKAAH